MSMFLWRWYTLYKKIWKLMRKPQSIRIIPTLKRLGTMKVPSEFFTLMDRKFLELAKM